MSDSEWFRRWPVNIKKYKCNCFVKITWTQGSHGNVCYSKLMLTGDNKVRVISYRISAILVATRVYFLCRLQLHVHGRFFVYNKVYAKLMFLYIWKRINPGEAARCSTSNLNVYVRGRQFVTQLARVCARALKATANRNRKSIFAERCACAGRSCGLSVAEIREATIDDRCNLRSRRQQNFAASPAPDFRKRVAVLLLKHRLTKIECRSSFFSLTRWPENTGPVFRLSKFFEFK